MPQSLVDEDTVQKIALLTSNAAMVYSGMGPDARVLVRKARKQVRGGVWKRRGRQAVEGEGCYPHPEKDPREVAFPRPPGAQGKNGW